MAMELPRPEKGKGWRKMQAGQRQDELRGRRVLVVEDEVLAARDYCRNLQEAGAEVVGPFHTVDDALDCVGNARIDVAVLDYALADRNSDDLQNVLESRKIPFVVVTAYPRVLVRRSENQKVLSKPISPNKLCESVRAACR
jgi:DNA-binding response OmpR family regulator